MTGRAPAHGAIPGPRHRHTEPSSKDALFFDAPGKEGLGDLDISEDGTELYAVNLADRQLYVYDATQPTALAPTTVIPLPDPGCAAAGDWRPGHSV